MHAIARVSWVLYGCGSEGCEVLTSDLTGGGDGIGYHQEARVKSVLWVWLRGVRYHPDFTGGEPFAFVRFWVLYGCVRHRPLLTAGERQGGSH